MSDATSGEDLFHRLENLSASVDGLRDAVIRERTVRVDEIDAAHRELDTAERARHRSNLALGVAAAAALLGALVSLALFASLRGEIDRRERDQVQQLVVSCVNGNASRAAVVDGDLRVGSLYTKVLGAVSARPEMTAEELTDRASRLTQLQDQFAAEYLANLSPALGPRDCTPAAVTTPTTVPTTLAPGR